LAIFKTIWLFKGCLRRGNSKGSGFYPLQQITPASANKVPSEYQLISDQYCEKPSVLTFSVNLALNDSLSIPAGEASARSKFIIGSVVVIVAVSAIDLQEL
jgi:hypothetical protein